MRLRTMAFSLAFAFAVAGIVSAEESGNWFTRLFTRTSAKKADKAPEPKGGVPTLNPVLPKEPAIQAQANLQRRREVCQRLLEIALETADNDLYRKAEQLDQRVWDAYSASTGRSMSTERPIGEVSMRDVRAAMKGGR